MRAAIWITLAQLAGVALPVLVGFLAGRHIRQRHLDQAERDAWHDGFAEGFHVAARTLLHADPDRIAIQLDAAVEHAPHPSDQPWLN